MESSLAGREGERGKTHLLEGQVGPTPQGGTAHTSAALSYGVAAWWVPLVSPRYYHVAKLKVGIYVKNSEFSDNFQFRAKTGHLKF